MKEHIFLSSKKAVTVSFIFKIVCYTTKKNTGSSARNKPMLDSGVIVSFGIYQCSLQYD